MRTQTRTEQTEQYKETELGLLPESWEIVRLGDIFKLASGKSRPMQITQTLTDEFLYPVYGGNGILGYSKEYLVDHETIVIGRVGAYCGSIYVVSGKNWISDNALYAKSFIKKCNLIYLSNKLRLLDLNKLKNTGGQPLINQAIIYSQKIPLPSLPEQQKIAFVLSTIQSAQETIEAIITALREMKKSMMKHLFTYGPVSLEEAKNVKLKEIEFGMIPDNWELVKLGNISTMIVPQRNKPKKFDGDIPWIRIEDFDGKYISDSKSNQKVSEETIKNMHLRPFPIGTVLCSCSGNMGICAITKEVLISNQTFIGIVTNDKLDPEYLYYLLSYSQKRLEALGIGVTIHYISRNKFEALEIPLPPIKAQNQISSILSQIDLKIESEETKKNSFDELFKSMLHNLMTAKIRVNDWEANNNDNNKP